MTRSVRHVMLIDTTLGGTAIATGALSPIGFIRRCSSLDSIPRSAENKLAQEVARIWRDHEPSKVIVSVGPGSFTSIRIALAFCRGLVADPQNLIGASSLLGMAEVLAEERGKSCRLLMSITEDFGVVAEVGKDNIPRLHTLNLNMYHSVTSGIIVGSWPKVADLLEDENKETITKMKLLDYGLKGLALLARRKVNDVDNSWPRPLYMRRPPIQSSSEID